MLPLNLIMPGMKAVFDLQITENIGTVNNYLLDVDYKVAYPKNQVIEITSSEMKYGPSQNLIFARGLLAVQILHSRPFPLLQVFDFD